MEMNDQILGCPLGTRRAGNSARVGEILTAATRPFQPSGERPSYAESINALEEAREALALSRIGKLGLQPVTEEELF